MAVDTVIGFLELYLITTFKYHDTDIFSQLILQDPQPRNSSNYFRVSQELPLIAATFSSRTADASCFDNFINVQWVME